MTTRADHWRALEDAGLMASPPEDDATAAWYIRALQAFGAWVASLFLFAALLALIGFDDAPAALMLLGALSLAAAFAILRGGVGGFVYQASLAVSLAGQLCITLALAQWGDALMTAIGVMVVAAALVLLMDDYVHRLLATLAFCGGLTAAAHELGAADVAAPLLAIPFALAWSGELRWRARRPVLEPAALGLGVGLLAIVYLMPWFGRIVSTVGDAFAPMPVRTVVLFGALAWTLRGALDDVALTGTRRMAALATGIAAALALDLAVPGNGLVLLVLVVAIRAQRPALAVLAVATLLVPVGKLEAFHAVSGMALLVLYGVARRRFGVAPRTPRVAGLRLDRAATAAIASVVVCLSWAALGVWRNEAVLAHGRVLVLELAPVDPRSMMQGDYMALGFVLQRDVRARLPDDDARDGWAVVSPDDAGVARFVELRDAMPPPSADRLAIQYRWRGRRLDMLPDGYFFQEGTADAFAAARYGAFRVGDDGRVLLQALLDEDRQPILSAY